MKRFDQGYKLSTERNKALSAFQRFCRLSEVNNYGYGRCWTCGSMVAYNESDGGHGIPKDHRATELERSNCHIQCLRCNRILYGRRDAFMEHVADEYGQDEVNRLNDMDAAYNGSEDAMMRLSEEDLLKVKRTRDGEWYHTQYVYWHNLCKKREKEIENNG